MATLQEKRINFNPKLTVSNTGGNLSTDAGLILVKEFYGLTWIFRIGQKPPSNQR